MALPSRFPLTEYLKVEGRTVKEIDKILTRAARELSKQIAASGGLNPMTRIQLEAQQASIKAYLKQDWRNIETAIAAGQRDAAQAASRVVSAYEDILLSQFVTKETLADFVNSQAQQAGAGVRSMMDRLGGSYRPLSQNVYGTARLVDGQVDRAVNVALARGMNAREFAAYIRKYISPTTPGGASYAAKRLARTEINNAFHEATNRRYKESGIVEVVDWHLSTSHPEGDECDGLKENGPYDVDEIPVKPHPQCLCYTTPGLPNRAQFIDNLFAGKYGDEPWEADALSSGTG